MSAIKCYDGLWPHMVSELNGMEKFKPLGLQAVQKAAREFCRESERWRETLHSQNLTVDITNYTVDWNYNARIDRIEEVRWNTEDGIDAGNKGVVRPRAEWTYSPPETLDFITAPVASVTNGLEIDVVLVPHLDSCDIAEWFLNRYAEPIIGWAMHFLMSMQGKMWTNPQRARQYMDDYHRGLTAAQAEKSRAFTVGYTAMGV